MKTLDSFRATLLGEVGWMSRIQSKVSQELVSNFTPDLARPNVRFDSEQVQWLLARFTEYPIRPTSTLADIMYQAGQQSVLSVVKELSNKRQGTFA